MSLKFKLSVLMGLLVVISLPYLLAYGMAGDQWVFEGLLQNPIDGQTYLAKMMQGAQGEWRFKLPYTAEPGDGAYVYLDYLLLGHLAALAHLPLILVYHLARLAGAAILVLGLIAFYEEVFGSEGTARAAVLWSVFGGGLGWLVVFFGLLPSDVWVAEMYPFLSAYTNPHFPLGLGVMLWMLVLSLRCRARGRGNWKIWFSLAGLSLILSAFQPFGVVVVGVILIGWLLVEWLITRGLSWKTVIFLGTGFAPGGLYLVYQYVAIQSDPMLAGWNAQNLNSSPPVWDFVISLSPALILACVAVWALWQEKRSVSREARLLLVWAATGLVLSYMPISFQRRFLVGYYIPLVGLAVIGISALSKRWPGKSMALRRWSLGLSLPSSILVIIIGLFGILSHAPELYLTRDESLALDWIADNSLPNAIILAGPEMGLYIPAQTGRRVIYGHPFETIDAKAQEQVVTEVYQGAIQGQALDQFLLTRQVDFILYGERDQMNGALADFTQYPVVFESGQERIYAVREQP